MSKIEQIDNGKIVIDSDKKLTRNEFISVLKSNFNVLNSKNPYEVKIDNSIIKLHAKQVTYLGNPHRCFKKRIQLSKGWGDSLKDENSYLIGLYKYKTTLMYVFFDKANFVNRKTNNSSAHVSTFDILNAYENGIFTKKDIRGNIVTVVKSELANDFLNKLVNKKVKLAPEISLFEDFKNSLNTKYHGKTCYSEMIKDNYKNKFQPEWVGFFLEYKFETFLNKNPELKLICNYQSNKKKGEIDLDLNFNNKYFGDLKAHSNESSAILGNDKSNINEALNVYNKIWYIVFNHETKKDKDYSFEVTKFWNESQNKEDLMSYSAKMKNNIRFTDFKILEINNYNKQYLSDFNQGINSNGLPRDAKIKIEKKSIDNFLIYNGIFNK